MFSPSVFVILIASFAADAEISVPPVSEMVRVPEQDELAFDFGTAESPVAIGYVRVGAARKYDGSNRFGFETDGQAAFDDGTASEKPSSHPERNDPIPDAVRRDGVERAKRLLFVAEVPRAGPYWVYATVGRRSKARSNQRVSIDGHLAGEDIDGSGPSATSLSGVPTRTVKTYVEASSGAIRIEVTASGAGGTGSLPASLVAVRIRRLDIPPSPEDLKEGSFFRRALLLERELQGVRGIGSKGEAKRLRDLVSAYRAALTTEIRAGSPFRSVARDRLEAAERLRLARAYLDMGISPDAERRTGSNAFARYWKAHDLANAMTGGDPLFHRSQALCAQVAFWMARMGGAAPRLAMLEKHLEPIRNLYPNSDPVKLYGSTQPFPLPPTAEAKSSREVPGWATSQLECRRGLDLVVGHWTKLQSEDGRFGGSWEEGLELMRRVFLSAFAVGDRRAHEAYRRFEEGLLDSVLGDADWWVPTAKPDPNLDRAEAASVRLSRLFQVWSESGNPAALDVLRRASRIADLGDGVLPAKRTSAQDLYALLESVPSSVWHASPPGPLRTTQRDAEQLDHLDFRFRQLARHVGRDVRLATSECLFPHALSFPADRLLLEGLTPPSGPSGRWQSLVFWDDPKHFVAARVITSDDRNFRFSAYSVGEGEQTLRFRPGGLLRGKYEVAVKGKQGLISSKVVGWIGSGETIDVFLPPRQAVTVELSCKDKSDRFPPMADLVLSRAALRVIGSPKVGRPLKLRVRVYAIGIHGGGRVRVLASGEQDLVASFPELEGGNLRYEDPMRPIDLEIPWTPRTSGKKLVKVQLETKERDSSLDNNSWSGVIEVAR
ncbi:MAG: hypothetical protein AAF517_00260 [Planctomycetota bacterium]